ncbi:MAG TPA: Fic family protein [Ktedonobacterales bacterium]|nr:Fic family protein [Ktedonobacterales bacterium]
MSGTTGGNRYEYPNGVLRNKFGITDAALLAQAEASFTLLRLGEVATHPIAGQFDLAHLQAIHRYLFQDVYDWAGELRQVDISKCASYFAHFSYIGNQAATLFTRLAQEQHLRGVPPDVFARRAAYYLGEINVLHPFREGNGRTQRVFLTDLARQAGYHLDWSQVTPAQMTAASILSLMRGDNSGLEQILLAIISPLHP